MGQRWQAREIDLQARTRADELDKQKAGVPLDTPSLAILSNY